MPHLLLLIAGWLPIASAAGAPAGGRDFVIVRGAGALEAEHQTERLHGEERWDAAWRLSRLGDAGAEALVAALGSSDWRVVQVAAYGIGELQGELADPCRIADALDRSAERTLVPAAAKEHRSALEQLVRGPLGRTAALAGCTRTNVVSAARVALLHRLRDPRGRADARVLLEAGGAGLSERQRSWLAILDAVEAARRPDAENVELDAALIAGWLRDVSSALEPWAHRLETTGASQADLRLALDGAARRAERLLTDALVIARLSAPRRAR